MKKHERFAVKLRQIQSLFSRFYAKVLTTRRLTIPQFSFLILVVDEGPLQMSCLAERLHLASSSVTNLADRLLDHRLIIREPHPEDRRAVLVKSTRRGKQIVGEIRRTTVDTFACELSSFSRTEMKAVQKFQDVMIETIERQLKQMKIDTK